MTVQRVFVAVLGLSVMCLTACGGVESSDIQDGQPTFQLHNVQVTEDNGRFRLAGTASTGEQEELVSNSVRLGQSGNENTKNALLVRGEPDCNHCSPNPDGSWHCGTCDFQNAAF
jgi:hypothetical protein